MKQPQTLLEAVCEGWLPTSVIHNRAKALVRIVADATSRASIYSRDFEEAKRALNSLIEAQKRSWEWAFRSEIKENSKYNTFYYSAPRAHNLVSFYQRVTAAIEREDDIPLTALRESMEPFLGYAKALADLKPHVIKGRAPRTTERRTAQRTLDHTGTCPICGQNVKLRGGRLVAHGYKVLYGSFRGQCFGVGSDPMERSVAAVRAYLAQRLIPFQERRTAHLECLTQSPAKVTSHFRTVRSSDRVEHPLSAAKGDPNYPLILGEEISHCVHELRMVGEDIAYRTSQITCWAEKPLPGEK